MASVDNRIVSLQFDNTDFERKVAGTIKSLDELEKKLNFSSSKDSLAGLNDIDKGIHFDGIGGAIEDISKKFLALSTVAITVLSNIASKAFDVGLSVVKSLSLDPVMDGYHEWETNMNSIQTIMANTASKGTNLQQVNDALDQLNTYSDQTIYNFGEMARNIGTFTAAGVDLNTSVNSIKGIANIAAISGSSSEQASTAMYQLSQAIAAGSVKLMDWNSVVNAGMGGEVFQKALFETGKSLKTIKDVPIGMTFEEWTKKGNTFRGSLEDGWLTSKVLTTTLQSFTGDLTEAQLTALGYTQQQAQEMMRLGALGKSAATEVKTLSQLLSTVKESVGSGWAESFRIIFGNFEEAKTLFTGLNNVIGKYVSAQADARNQLLQGWKDLGGRTKLIEALQSAFHGLVSIITPIKEAFRDIFPPLTAQRLMEITNVIKSLADELTISGETAGKIKSIFSGLFSILSIGWTIIKNLAVFIGDLIMQLSGVGSGFLDGAAKVGDFLTNLQNVLVKGGGIHDFFLKLTVAIQKPIEYIKDLKDKIVDFFSSASGPVTEATSNAFGRLSDRIDTLHGIVKGLASAFKWLLDQFQKIMPILEAVWNAISNWFHELGDKLSAVLQPGDFNKVLDALNVGLLGGILVMLQKFFKSGLKLDFGGGFLEGIKNSLDSLTGTLDAMQTKLKAEALMKIAEAIALLAASLLVLSLIDSGALTRALGAVAIGFGELIASLAALNQMSSGARGALTLDALATALVVIAGAMLVLAGAVAILGTMSMDEITKGLGSIIVLLTAMVVVTKLLAGDTAGMIAAGIGMMGIAIALNLLAAAMKIFATMSWKDMLKGFVGVAGGLLIIAGAMQLMPANMILTGAGLVAVGIGLNLLAASMKIFATMSWTELGKGLVAVAGGLLIIAGAMQLMPISLPITAVGLILVGVALNIIAGAMKLLATMSWGEIAKGLASMAGALLILVIATNAMSGAIVGAAAMIIVATALTMLVAVLKVFAAMKVGDIVKALIALAAVFLVIGLAALVLEPVIPAMLALGAALLMVGAGLALFGVGAYLAATAFKVLAEAGKAGIDVLMALIDAILKKLPEMVAAFAMSIVQLAETLLAAAPILVDMLGVLIVHILETLVKIAPALGETLIALIDMVINVLRAEIPNIIQLGFDILMALLTGINDHIGEITTKAIEIVTNFINAISDNMPMIVDSAVNLLTTFLNELANHAAEIVTAGLNLLTSLLQGVGDNIQKVIDKAGDVIVKFINGIDQKTNDIITAGTNMIVNLMEGIGRNASYVVSVGVDTVISFIQGLGQNAVRLANAAGDVVVDFLNGIADAIRNHNGEIRAAGANIASAMISGLTGGLSDGVGGVITAAKNVATSAFNAAKGVLGIGSPSKKFHELGMWSAIGLSQGMDDDTTVVDSATNLGNSAINALQESLNKAAIIINQMPEFSPTITPVLDLTQVQKDAGVLSGMLNESNALSAGGFSYSQAQTIFKDETRRQAEAAPVETPVVQPEIKFEQNNYSPEALSTNDIYRNTRNQIALAREELSIA